MNNRILFVDDDNNLLDAIQRSLRKQFSIETALGGREALQKVSEGADYAVIVADMQMPEMSGLEFLRKVQEQAPNSVRMMLTGNSDLKTAVDAVNDGRVFRYLTKPCPPPTLAPALDAGLEQYRFMQAERDLLENTLGGAVKVLTEILSTIDPAVFERGQKLKEYVQDFTKSTNSAVSWELEMAAMLAQIGRVTVPSTVLERTREGAVLSALEKTLLQQVPEFGARLLENIPRLEKVAAIVRYQHKRFDGSGFPNDKIAGEEIPVGARILKVLDDLIEFEESCASKAVAFQIMQERLGWYDVKVLAAASRWCDVALGAAPVPRPAPQLLRVDELKTGQVLAQDLRTPEGLLILAANTKLTPMLLVKLLNFRTLRTIDNTLLVHVA